MPWSTCLKVVLALITDELKRILITQRPLDVSHGGCWEFPGGKVEIEESAETALAREIKEELGIDIQKFHFLGETSHQYSEKKIHFLIYHVTYFKGSPERHEGQLNMKWVMKAHLNMEEFPEANRAIFNFIP